MITTMIVIVIIMIMISELFILMIIMIMMIMIVTITLYYLFTHSYIFQFIPSLFGRQGYGWIKNCMESRHLCIKRTIVILYCLKLTSKKVNKKKIPSFCWLQFIFGKSPTIYPILKIKIHVFTSSLTMTRTLTKPFLHPWLLDC